MKPIVFRPTQLARGTMLAATEGRYLLEVKPPLGWHIPPTPPPPGALRLTVGGQPPAEAPASLLIHAVASDGDSFLAYTERELAAVRASFTQASEASFDPEFRAALPWRSLQITGRMEDQRTMALIAMLEAPTHFVWFGMIVRDRSLWERAPIAFRSVLSSFREQRYADLIATVSPI